VTPGSDPAGDSLAGRVARAAAEEIVLAPYDPRWPELFRLEKEHLRSCLPPELVRRVEHFGSTAVPGMSAKPIIDMLIETADLRATRLLVAPRLEAQGYDYFWRPTAGDDGPPFYAWFIKRDPRTGARTHQLHMVEASFRGHWERLLFRDLLIAEPQIARDYERLKLSLAAAFPHDRAAYTRGKSEFIAAVMGAAS